ncbi:hypothetical protein CABS01_15686 [Colletotrichum abscissum]|uniref:Uncharacterized protein n=1 Tax=Colletotrichum abscissum TaxID=1671311 RepID=A0A9Q0AZI8_9PEZI|nr:uncharacterized protein CABS01_15686 [Colletotrichum abscissum]KAI3541896.1 hypothetical protein CABS02_10576 [Colletotrichum abscissum]KAK1474920.1 hypothetical protein CABS01_15686 [Colletotrichum abscissum]
MAPQQNTFAVIPDAPGRVGGPANRPPMTSKQAQKLYKQANKEPRRSKAEQRKWEKEKQEEIRKELEKERAAVKAKAARERKKAKEEEARENRRRAGQPLFDCRPSQDTIARFVRGNGSHKKRDSSGEPIPKPETASAALADIKPNNLASTAASKPPLQIESSEERKPSIGSMAPPPRPSQITKSAMSAVQGATTCERQSSAEGVVPKPIDKDALTRQPLKPLFTAPEKAPAVMASIGPPPRPAVKAKSRPFMMPKATLPTHQPPRHKIFKQKPSLQPSIQIKTEVSLPKELPSPKSAPPKSSTAMPPPPVPSQKPRVEAAEDKAPTDVPIPIIAPSPGVRSKQILPPPRPSIPQMPLPSTQAIVQNCFDDFFPTASQLAVELEEDFDGAQTALPSRLSAPIPSKAPAQGSTGPLSRPKETGSLANERNLPPAKSNFSAIQNHESNLSSRHKQIANLGTHVRATQPPTSITNKLQTRHGLAQKEQIQKQQQQKYMMPRAASGPKLITHGVIAAAHSTPLVKRQGAPPLIAPNRFPNRGILQEISSNHRPAPKPTVAKALHVFDDFFPLICTQDLMMSSQEVLDIESPAKAMTQSSSGGPVTNSASSLIEMDLGSIDWDDDLDDF